MNWPVLVTHRLGAPSRKSAPHLAFGHTLPGEANERRATESGRRPGGVNNALSSSQRVPEERGGTKAERRDGSRPFFCRRGFAGRFPTDRPAAACVWRASHLVVLKVSRSVDLNLICQRHQGPGGGTSPVGGAVVPGGGGVGTPGRAPALGGTGCGGTEGAGSGWTFTLPWRPPCPIRFWVGSRAPGATGAVPTGGGGSIPMARIRARWVAACVLAQGKSGPDGKY